MKNKKIIKVILLSIFIILLIIVIYVLRNFIIITNLQDNLTPYLSSTNYHLKTVCDGDRTSSIVNYYTKDGKQVVIRENYANGVTNKVSMYDNGEIIISYYDNVTDKIVKLNIPSKISVNIMSYFEGLFEGTMQKIYMSAMLKIQNTEYNGKSCYIISPLFSNETTVEYIEKDTGLCLKAIMYGETVEKEYEFANVDDEVFIEPDISEYTIKEEN